MSVSKYMQNTQNDQNYKINTIYLKYMSNKD